MIICVPSSGRLNFRALQWLDTLSPFFQEKHKVHLWVHESEVNDYKEVAALRAFTIKQHSEVGMGAIRRVMQMAYDESILMADDDIVGWLKRDGLTEKGNPRYVKVPPDVVLTALEERLKTHPLVHIPSLQFGWRYENGDKSVRMWSSYALSPVLKESGILFDEKCPVFEDFDFQAQVYENGLPVWCLFDHAYDPGSTAYAKAAGGLQLIDRALISEATTHYLLGKWGDYVRPVTKKNGFFEIQFKWKKIRESKLID